MKLYVCWGTFWTPRPGGHPCHNAYTALRDAGHDPEVIKVHGLGIGPVGEGQEVFLERHMVSWRSRSRQKCLQLRSAQQVGCVPGVP